MTCTYSKTRRPVRYTPQYSNWINEFFNTAVGDVVQNADKRYTTNPATNVLEYDDRFELKLALPGFAKKDIAIELDKDVLKVASDATSEEETKYRLREFNYAGFKKHFKIPKTVKRDAVHAGFADGILTITLNKKDEEIPQPAKNITIN